MQLTRKRQSVPRIGGLPASRHSAIALSLLCAVVAAGIIVVALGNYRKSIQSTAKQETILMATSLIPQGTSAQTAAAQRLYRPALVLVTRVTPGAITDAAVLQGRFAAQNILPGEQIKAAEFTAGSTISYQLAPDQRAVSIALDTSHGNVGVLQNGDHVDVYGSFNYGGSGHLGRIPGLPTSNSGGTGGSNSTPVVRLLAANALVLRVPGGAGAGGIGGSAVAANGDVVLAVTQTQTPDLTFASDWGKVWLTLRPANATNPDQAITDIDTLVLGIRTLVFPHADGSVNLTGVGGLVPGGQVPAITGQRWAAGASK